VADRSLAEAAPTPAVRRLLAVAAVLVFLAGVQLFVFPFRTDEWFAWTIDSPMTAVFLGASYWSAVGLELTAARAASWAGARIAIPAVFVFTTVTMVVTLVHIDRFHLDSTLPLGTRAVTWAWLAVYAVVPVLMVLAVVAQRRRSVAVPSPSGLPTAVRVALVAIAAVLLVLGTALLIDPAAADGSWPWPLTPLTGRAVGAWLVGLGVAAAHARLLDDVVSLRPLAITGVAFGVLQAVALLRHGDELSWDEPAAYGYVGMLVAVAAVSLWALLASTAASVDPVTGRSQGEDGAAAGGRSPAPREGSGTPSLVRGRGGDASR
jgi:hypothetical protein